MAIGGRCDYSTMDWWCEKQEGHEGPHGYTLEVGRGGEAGAVVGQAAAPSIHMAPSGGMRFYPCQGYPEHDYAVGPTHAVCNRCEKVVELSTTSARPETPVANTDQGQVPR